MTWKSLLFLTAFVDALLGASAGAVSGLEERGHHGRSRQWRRNPGDRLGRVFQQHVRRRSGSAGKVVGRLGAIMNPVLPPAACSWSPHRHGRR